MDTGMYVSITAVQKRVAMQTMNGRQERQQQHVQRQENRHIPAVYARQQRKSQMKHWDIQVAQRAVRKKRNVTDAMRNMEN